jgi:hypothetical protein
MVVRYKYSENGFDPNFLGSGGAAAEGLDGAQGGAGGMKAAVAGGFRAGERGGVLCAGEGGATASSPPFGRTGPVERRALAPLAVNWSAEGGMGRLNVMRDRCSILTWGGRLSRKTEHLNNLLPPVAYAVHLVDNPGEHNRPWRYAWSDTDCEKGSWILQPR